MTLMAQTDPSASGLALPYRYDLYRGGTDRFEVGISQIYSIDDSPEHFRLSRTLELTFWSDKSIYRQTASDAQSIVSYRFKEQKFEFREPTNQTPEIQKLY